MNEWKVIQQFFDENSLVKQQIDSYNYFWIIVYHR